MGTWASVKEYRSTKKELRKRSGLRALFEQGHHRAVYVFDNELVYHDTDGAQTFPLDGAHFGFDQSGGVSARGTLTRAATVGGGWQKKTDDRQVLVTIEGPEFAWVFDMTPDSDILRGQMLVAVRQMVAEANQAARRG